MLNLSYDIRTCLKISLASYRYKRSGDRAMAARLAHNQEVSGSSPLLPTNINNLVQ